MQQACCWANATMNKHFKLEVSIETNLERINHSPYPYIPASYYVDYEHPQDIKVFASDLDGELNERFDESSSDPIDMQEIKLSVNTTQIH